MKAYRLLRADEVEVRISTCNVYGVGLLLYKDARCDMNLLDEVHGSLNWQNHYDLIDGQLFATVEVWDPDKGQWIQKQNVGTESFTEKEKGRASDAFKRACFNFGVGRELYTAPNMWVMKKDLKTHEKDDKGKWTCRDVFRVESLEYDGESISYVTVRNLKTDGLLEFGTPKEIQREYDEMGDRIIPEVKAVVLKSRCEHERVNVEKLCQLYKVASIDELNEKKFANINAHWEAVKEACSA